ncbi:hypothetical protein [Sulfobacillus sp. hq2]|uniref:hypothetical protein n=1 Tax=Sulfobacillus TaxID=28033 RepID=UPI000CD00FB0|nr:hypothetical protein [Sulfobacillus sp. hq2]POB11443.1 hypothetical protein CO251_04680 [Sulfobacillus sp. hq2]
MIITRHRRRWTPIEDQLAAEWYERGHTAHEIGKNLRRTAVAVQCRLTRLGVRRHRAWTTKELLILRHWTPHTLTTGQTEMLFGRSIAAVYAKRREVTIREEDGQ